TKYTLGKWVDTIIVQMNDPSIDDIELDETINKSNFNMAKEKEAAAALAAAAAAVVASATTMVGTNGQKPPTGATKELEYAENSNPSNDDELSSDKDDVDESEVKIVDETTTAAVVQSGTEGNGTVQRTSTVSTISSSESVGSQYDESGQSPTT